MAEKTELLTQRVDDLAESIREELAGMTVKQLKDQLARQLEMSAENLTRLALTIRELENRGEDLSDLKLGLMPYLRRMRSFPHRAFPQRAGVVVRTSGWSGQTKTSSATLTSSSLPHPSFAHREGVPVRTSG